jgi:hypothetical protein
LQNILARRIDRRALLWRDDRLCRLVAALRTALSQRLQLLLHGVQVLLQRLLGLAELRLGIRLHLIDQHERPH